MCVNTAREVKSRHPRIQYWFWDRELLDQGNYCDQLDVLVRESDFNTVILTERDGVNFFDQTLKPHFAKVIAHSHKLGLKIILQLWPLGQMNPVDVDITEAAAMVTEAEGQINGGVVSLTLESRHVRDAHNTVPLSCRLLKAYAFRKCDEGVYQAGTLVDVTDRAVVIPKGEQCLSLQLSLPEYEGCTVYAMAAHYYRYPDLFSEHMIRDFADIMEAYKDLGFDGFVLDELRNMVILPPWNCDNFRDRFYGLHFEEYFRQYTGKELVRTLFDMRYCVEGCVEDRISAINRYFDIFRHSTKRIEVFMAQYNQSVYDQAAFLGLHNTFHNWLQNDEIWMTCCNWWEVPRKYAQTDENMIFPIRMGIACQASESLIYDMYYHKEPQTFFEKLMKEACFGSRIHYHAMNDGKRWGADTGSAAFLKVLRPYEDCITLLDGFDPAGLPKMELLVVFGFPALCNWYPDYDARNQYDINGKLNIEQRVNDLWNNGYFNALAPSDAITDGRITLQDGRFDYCGHKFDKLLYLYPEYSKAEVTEFLESAARKGYDLRIIGQYTRDFEGKPARLNMSDEHFLCEAEDIAEAMALRKNDIPNGCILEDGSVLISDYESVENSCDCIARFTCNGNSYEAAFRGVFAMKPGGSNHIRKLAAGKLQYLKKDGQMLVLGSGDDYITI